MGLIAGISVFSIIELALTLMKTLRFSIRKSKVGAENVSRQRSKKTFLIDRDHLLYHLGRAVLEFLKESGIHGVHYLNDKATGVKMRAFWFLAIGISMACCSILVHDSFTTLQSSSVIIALDEKIWNVEEVKLHSRVLNMC